VTLQSLRLIISLSLCTLLSAASAAATDDRQLLDVLLENGSITQEQHDALSGRQDDGAEDPAEAPADDDLPPVAAQGDDPGDDAEEEELDDSMIETIGKIVAEKIDEELPVEVSYGSKGFRLETRDGNWQTNLQWRFQFRFTWPTRSDPRQVDDFAANEQTNFEARRLRMKIGGHGYRPWLKYYFELDLQPSRDTDDSSPSSNTRVIDWRVDLAKYKKIGLRVGQWKIDYNRERVDSSGRQQFVERSIVNRIFTVDRQVGVSLRGRLFEGTPADLRYYLGVFNGEGRGINNHDNDMMYVGRLQWNFLGRDLKLRQTDVERTELPTGSLAFGGATTKGVCTRWSSGGCGALDGFTSPGLARQGQYRIHQAVQEAAFKVLDRTFSNSDAQYDSNLWGLYAQTGYFFNEMFDWVPEELELAFRYAFVREPNETDRLDKNLRQEFTTGLNWFFAGHNNKLTLDYSYLTLDDDVLSRNVSDHRARFQWDVSF
jgi:hypothetical protein